MAVTAVGSAEQQRGCGCGWCSGDEQGDCLRADPAHPGVASPPLAIALAAGQSSQSVSQRAQQCEFLN